MQPFAFRSKFIECPSTFVEFGRFNDGSIAMRLRNANTGAPLTMATVNLSQYNLHPEEGNVFVYGDYSEHEGVWAGLHRAGIVSDAVRRVPYGPYDAEAIECKLLVGQE